MSKLKVLTGRIPPAYKLPTGSFGLNRALEGGLKGGRFHAFWGPKASGKTTLAMTAVAEAQRMGKVCLWVDAEKTYDSAWAEACGVDVDELRVIISLSAEDIVETVGPMIEKGEVDMVVIDSLSTLSMDSYFDKSSDKSIGIGAKSQNFVLHKLLNAMGLETQVIVIVHGTMQQAGGQMMSLQANLSKRAEHWASTIIKFRKGMAKDKDEREDGAIRIYWKVEKSKQSPYPVLGEYWLQVTPDAVFIDQASEIVDEAVALEIIERKGAWFKFEEEQYQGLKAVVAAVKSDSGLAQRLAERVNEFGVVALEEEDAEG